MECNRRGDRSALPADCADRARRRPGDDPLVAQQFLGTDGGRDHGRVDFRDHPHTAIRARSICGVVPRQEAD